jgi:hypothetical protein
LPAALAHYADELIAILHAAGHLARTEPVPSIERSLDEPVVARTAKTVSSRLGLRRLQDDVIVLWPAFGLLDPITFLGRRAHTWLIVHDPTPLRRQLGMGFWAAKLGRLALTRRLTIVVHSEPARQVMADRDWPVVMAPHPILPPTDTSMPRGPQVRVLGQWKPARDLSPLQALASDPALNGRREIVGRGWPDVPGWKVDARFLSEDDLDRQISEASAVVLPYERYFQSGIAVRCLEQRTPVIGRAHPFLSDLFGADWPGTVTDDDWSAGVVRASRQAPQALAQRHAEYWERCVEAWRGLLTRVA